jgi:murein DD-endopeptidase MepM/ murein hydrolase activator NlpD
VGFAPAVGAAAAEGSAAASAATGAKAAGAGRRATAAGAGAGKGKGPRRKQTAQGRRESQRGYRDEAGAALDDPAYRRELKGRDAERSRAYDAGRARARQPRRARGERPGYSDTELDELDTAGERAGARERRRERAGDLASNAGGRLWSSAKGPAHDAGGFVLGLLAYALLMAYLEDGVPGVRRWLAAKFLNRVPGDPTTTSAVPSSSTSAGAIQPATYNVQRGSGAAGEPAGFAFPVAGGAKFSDDWGAPRGGGKRRHEGNDLFASRGTPVLAALAGTVLPDFTDNLGGNVVRILGTDGRRYYYAHLNAVEAQAGAFVNAGDVIGSVGNSGDAAGGPTHLHFGVYERQGSRWAARDPFAWLTDAIAGGSATSKPTDPAVWA